MIRTTVAKATGPRWIHLTVALLPAIFAAPAGAQLQEALAAQVEVDRQAAAAQAEIDGIRERTQDAQGRVAQMTAETAMSTSWTISRFIRPEEGE